MKNQYNNYCCVIEIDSNAPVAELADAQRSGRCMGFHVQVRILFGASVSSVVFLPGFFRTWGK